MAQRDVSRIPRGAARQCPCELGGGGGAVNDHLQLVVAQLNDTAARIRVLEAGLAKWHRVNTVSRLLAIFRVSGLWPRAPSPRR